MKQIELKEKRKPREKHFLQEDGTIVAEVYSEDVHYLKDGKYEEIDNKLTKQGKKYINKSNRFTVEFNGDNKYLFRFAMNSYFVKAKLKDAKNIIPEVSSQKRKTCSSILYKNVLDNVSICYKIKPNSVKELIVLENKENYTKNNDIVFELNVNKDIKLNKNGNIELFDNFYIDNPYMVDSNGAKCNNIKYDLTKDKENYYLKLILDKEWLCNNNIVYPVTIDPTIIDTSSNSVFDTYISYSEPNSNKGSEDILKVGAETTNNTNKIYRTLLKFSLPSISTSCQIIDAQLDLIGYPVSINPYATKTINVHRLKSDFNENTATWNNMNDKYDENVESTMFCAHSTLNNNNQLQAHHNRFKITNLVKKWYTDTPNYGVMLKLNDENEKDSNIASFYSKNNNVSGSNPKPVLIITYRNQNGLEDYMSYHSQAFVRGNVYQNLFNGNLTSLFGLISTRGGMMPISLSIVYNTNDVVLNNNFGVGWGYKLNYYQTIKEVTINNYNYLEYLDADGTIHYFYNDNGIYKDEDNLEMTIEKIEEDSLYTLKNGDHTYWFNIVNNVGYLTGISDAMGNSIRIYYDENNRIETIVDDTSREIIISYQSNCITISSETEEVTLTYNNNQLTNIVGETGSTTFDYNNYGLISSIIDETGIYYLYSYYQNSPYKVYSVNEYGTNQSAGKSYNYIYGFNETKVIDQDNKCVLYTFNLYGNTVSEIFYSNGENIIDAYGKSTIFGETGNVKNRIISDQITKKYVKNVLTNTDFENESLIFTADNVYMEISDDYSNSGNSSLKISSEVNEGSIYKSVSLEKGKYYTFSSYIKNNCNLQLQLSYVDSTNNNIVINGSTIYPNNLFERQEVTIFYPENAISDLLIKIVLINPGLIYIDNIQLEEGMVANTYNYIENSDFSDGLNGWDFSAAIEGIATTITDKYDIVTNQGKTALEVKMNPAYDTRLEKTFNINGKAGEIFNISFWYKNGGLEKLNNITDSIVSVYFNYDEELLNQRCMLYDSLNSACKNWQYHASSFVALGDFDSVTIVFSQTFNANNFYLTNINMCKDLKTISFNYDENGNVTSVKELNKNKGFLNYDSNEQLLKITSSVGDSFIYEYDLNIPDKVINGISDSGISNEIVYNEDGRPISTIISKKQVDLESMDNSTSCPCSIRIYGTSKYLLNIKNEIKVGGQCPHNNCWIINKNSETYSIKHAIVIDKFFSTNESNVMLDSHNVNSELLLIKNNDNSYLIKNQNNKYLKYNKDTNDIIMTDLIDNDNSFHFYFETRSSNSFIENNASYDINNRFICELIDAELNSKYSYYRQDGLIDYEINEKGIYTDYEYNENKQLISIQNSDKTVNYYYDENTELLTKIVFGDMTYNFVYDEYLKLKQVLIDNNVVLINNQYETHNGNLISCTYANGDTINYNYDGHNRISSKFKGNEEYKYIYDDNNEVSKLIFGDHMLNVIYDTNKRIHKYKFDNFTRVKNYDDNDSVVQEINKLYNDENIINYEYNDNGEIQQITIDGHYINYQYDEFGRLLYETINNNNIRHFNYKSKGKRLSLTVDNIDYDDNNMSYKFDKLNNITHIYLNNNLIKKYEYDDYNQLIKEDNYIDNYYIKYYYNYNGNITSKKTFGLDDYNIISNDVYEYNNTWSDQMTKFNNINISYDNLGNMVSIGNNTLQWQNGNELKMISMGNNSILFEYDDKGLRISKTVNNEKTNYYYSENKLLFEEKGNNRIFYLYDNDDNVCGFKYNNQWYFYVKNLQNDIIRIIDSNNQTVAIYEYDSWGNVISIRDNNGNAINNQNHIAFINPFRYKSYYYDIETNLYYLNKRYYSPSLMRFINADCYIGTGNGLLGYNMYLYVNNNPINNADYKGKKLSKILKKIKNALKKNKKKIIKTVVKIVATVACALIKHKINKTIKDFKRTFVVEVGGGPGININGKKLGVTGSITTSYKYKNGKITKHINQGNGYSLVGIGVSYQSSCTFDEKGNCPTYVEVDGKKYQDFDYDESYSINFSDFVSIDTYGRFFIGYNPTFSFASQLVGFIKIGWEYDDYADIEHKYYDD